MQIRESLINLLRETIGALSLRKTVAWPTVVTQLDEARRVALADAVDAEGSVTSVVSAVNLLTDCVRGAVVQADVAQALKALDVGPGWDKAFAGLVRHGPTITVSNDMAMGYSALRWRMFLLCYGPELNAPINNPRLQDRLWDDMTSSSYLLPMGTVTLADPSGTSSSWVTDDGDEGKKLRTSDPTTDVYDALGLDWTGRAERRTGTVTEARALLFGCRLRTRERAAGALHCPNAVDGWGNMFFVSRANTGKDWPNHGSATARPVADEPSLPEAIHGPALTSTDNVSFAPLGYIRIGDRAAEYGESVSARSIDRLRAAVNDYGQSV